MITRGTGYAYEVRFAKSAARLPEHRHRGDPVIRLPLSGVRRQSAGSGRMSVGRGARLR